MEVAPSDLQLDAYRVGTGHEHPFEGHDRGLEITCLEGRPAQAEIDLRVPGVAQEQTVIFLVRPVELAPVKELFGALVPAGALRGRWNQARAQEQQEDEYAKSCLCPAPCSSAGVHECVCFS